MDTRTGRVVANAETRQVNDKHVTNFTVAVNRDYVRDGHKVENTEYVECTVWNRERLGAHLLKGTVIEVLGSMQAKAYINKKNQAVGVLAMNVRDVKFHSGKRNSTGQQPTTVVETVADDLPF